MNRQDIEDFLILPYIFDVKEEEIMKRLMSLYCLLAATAMAIGLSGCIIVSASPDPKTIVEMKPGEKKIFKVVGPVNTPITKCKWSVQRMGVDDFAVSVLEGANEFMFEADPKGDKTNRILIICSVYSYGLYEECREACLPVLGWNCTGERKWEVRIRQDNSPIWQGNYYIRDNKDIQLLNGYTAVAGNVEIGSITQLPLYSDIKNLEGLNSLNTIEGDLIIFNNENLASLSGLQNLNTVGGGLYIISNYALTNLSGLRNLSEIGAGLNIMYNSILTDLSGLNNITRIGDQLHICYNGSLASLSGLNSITEIAGGLQILSNIELKCLSDLGNLTTIGADIDITGNAALTSLGLVALRSVGGLFKISCNNELCNGLVEGLRDQVENLDGIKGEIYIYLNRDCTTP